MSKVAITDYSFADLDPEKRILEPLGCTLVDQKEFVGEEKLQELVQDADYVITQFAPLNAAVIESMAKCRIIVRYGIGVDNVDLDAAAKRGIPVCNVPDYCVDEVADHTLAFILALARKVVPGWDVVRAGGWKLAVPLEEMHALKELTVGLVAYGKIAKEVAARLKAFKSKVLVFDPYVPANEIENDGLVPRPFDPYVPANEIENDGLVPTDLEGLLGNSDLISLHCPSTAETQQMINSQSISTMKRGVMLVNTSRGTLVNTADLVAALESGHISAAALDVVDPEPIPPDSPLLKMENVIIHSHVASCSVNSRNRLRTSVAEAVARAVRGEKLANVVNGVAG